MVSYLTVLIGIASVILGILVIVVAGSTWQKRRSVDYEPEPDDGCGCVELWEYLSERRSESRESRDAP